MSDAWRLVARKHGGPEVIERESFDPGQPGHGQLLLEQEAVGLNFIDVYYRSGVYQAELPVALGAESVGRVVAIGEGAQGFAIGDRVGCVNGAGAYATHRLIDAARGVHVPDDVSSEDAAAMMLKGFTACYLAEDMLPLAAGHVALVHSAAGGVGSILVPWLRDMGVEVIAHVGSPAKAAGVQAEHVLCDPFEDLASKVKAITGGKGVRVVFDGVGKASWSASLASLARRGLMVSYGNASGAVPPIALLDLMKGGSLFVSRPTMADYTVNAEDLAHTAERLFDRMERGVVKAQIGQRFALADAADAHRALEARETTGSTVLLP
jgi:NADPH2:quinone reductase